MSNSELSQLRSDIAERGCLVPIELDESGTVLDGHHRLEVCNELGITPPTITRLDLSEEEKRAHALTLNLTRRHLDPKQRQQLHRQMRKIGKSLRQIAAASGVSEATVRRDLAGATNDAPAQVIGRDGKAYKLKKRHVCSKAGSVVLPHFPEVAPPTGTYSCIYADPPWRYDSSPTSDRAIERHYPTMPLEEICALPVPAAEDAVLFLWATNTHLPGALEVMKAWGFEYKTNLCWVKDKFGLGIYVRGQHELLLIGKRGNISVPEAHNRPSSVIKAMRREHSRKPDCVYEIIEAMYPQTKKIELFARKAHQGWNCWGNQAPNS